MTALSIIMPCHNRAHGLVEVLEAYDRQSVDEPFEIIAVDDASTDDTYPVLQDFRPRHYCLRVERMEKNQGQGMARNLVIPDVEAPLILFTGDDMLPAPGFVQGHLEAHRRNPSENIAILGRIAWPEDLPRNTLMTHIDGVGAEQFSFYYLQHGQFYDFRHFYTSNISLSRKLLHSVKPWFDPRFYLYGFEDVELGYRLCRQGMQILYDRNPLAYHYHYHNIWTFSRRQCNSGVMLSVLFRMHPELVFQIPTPLSRVAGLYLWPKTWIVPLDPGEVDRLQALACRLMSFYEWQDTPGLDRLYSAGLEYFYYDGLIQGLYNREGIKNRLRSAYAQRQLIPAMLEFVEQNRQALRSIPGGDYQVLNRSIHSVSAN